MVRIYMLVQEQTLETRSRYCLVCKKKYWRSASQLGSEFATPSRLLALEADQANGWKPGLVLCNKLQVEK